MDGMSLRAVSPQGPSRSLFKHRARISLSCEGPNDPFPHKNIRRVFVGGKRPPGRPKRNEFRPRSLNKLRENPWVLHVAGGISWCFVSSFGARLVATHIAGHPLEHFNKHQRSHRFLAIVLGALALSVPLFFVHFVSGVGNGRRHR